MNRDTLSKLFGIADLHEQLAEVEITLDAAINCDADFLSVPARRVVTGGGKRLRPVLALAAAVAGGGGFSPSVAKAAAALELVHAGSLVHDDIIDRADARRGVATVSAVEGVNHALLVGDYLLARAGELAASVSREVAGALATAIVDLCRGQSLETATLFNAARTRNAYEASIDGKTAALLSCSCKIGALAVGAEPPYVDALATFGRAFGMAFQIIDDVLDLASSTQAMGKPVGKDIREGVYTLPIILMLAQPRCSALSVELVEDIDDVGLSRIFAGLDETGAISEALDIARGYNVAATSALSKLPASEARTGLEALPTEYLDWALREKARLLPRP